MTLWKRGGVYWSYVWIDGVRHAKSTGTANRRRAEKIDHDFKEELNMKREGLTEFQPDMTFGELSARFLADGSPLPYHRDRLKVLLPHWSAISIGRITKARADDYRKARHAQKRLSDTTINRDLEVLRRLLFWAVDMGFLAMNPLSRVRMVRERRKRRSVMSVGEEKKLLAIASRHLQRISILALDTGMRRGELLAQRWEDVDFDRGLLFVSHSKTPEGESREVPFTKRVESLLSEIRQSAGLIFTFNKKPIYSIKTAWATALRKSEIRRYRFHDLRHTFNTRLMEAGVLQEIRKSLMGHSSGEDVNSRYTHIELPAKREAIRKLERWLETEENKRKEEEEQKKEGQTANEEQNDNDSKGDPQPASSES
jgi:integrase